MEEWVTIAQFDNPGRGYIPKSKLESEGIECFLKDENVTNIIPLASLSIGGVKLQVRLRDSFKAMEIYYQSLDEIGDISI